GKDLFHQNSSGDGSRCGQFFNGPVYIGVSNPNYGILSAGRQNSPAFDLGADYDPMGLSYAFSLIGYSSTAGGGVGDTEVARLDNSVKYFYRYGPLHVAGMYAQGGQDTALHGDGYAANIGATLWGISADFVYRKENSAVSSASLSPANCTALGFTLPTCPAQ